MKPTVKLRFLECERPSGGTIRVLQQWWEDAWHDGEWRDVPLEKEYD